MVALEVPLRHPVSSPDSDSGYGKPVLLVAALTSLGDSSVLLWFKRPAEVSGAHSHLTTESEHSSHLAHIIFSARATPSLPAVGHHEHLTRSQCKHASSVAGADLYGAPSGYIQPQSPHGAHQSTILRSCSSMDRCLILVSSTLQPRLGCSFSEWIRSLDILYSWKS